MGKVGSFVLARFKLRGYEAPYIATLTVDDHHRLKSLFQITDCKIIHSFQRNDSIAQKQT